MEEFMQKLEAMANAQPSKIKTQTKKKPAARVIPSALDSVVVAIKAGDSDRMFEALGKESVDTTDLRHYTALFHAIVENQPELVKALIERGADVNRVNKLGSCPILYAARRNRVDIVKMLIAAGADVNARCASKEKHTFMTPLFLATYHGNAELLQVLLDAKADVTITNDYGENALYFAALSGASTCMSMLLDAGCDVGMVTIRDENRPKTALMVAAEEGHIETVDVMLSKGVSATVAAPDNTQPLHLACMEGRVAVARTLVKAGADPNAVNDGHLTPLTAAIMSGDEECVEMIVELGADVNKAVHDSTPLSFAITVNDEDIVAKLIAMGAHVDALVPVTPAVPALVLALDADNYVKACELVRFRDAAIKMRAFSRRYMDACVDATFGEGDVDDDALVREMMNHIHGSTVQRQADSEKAGKVAKELKDDDKSVRGAMKMFDERINLALVQTLIAAKADLGRTLPNGVTYLFNLVAGTNADSEHHNSKVIEALLAAKADPNARTQGNDTAMAVAVVNDLPDVAQLLIKYGFDVNGHEGLEYVPQEGANVFCVSGEAPITVVTSGATDAEAEVATTGSRTQLPCAVQTPLQLASSLGAHGVARVLLDAKACPNYCHTARKTDTGIFGVDSGNSLVKAGRHSDDKMVKMLLNAKADVLAATKAGNTALHVVLEREEPADRSVAAIIARKADVNAKNTEGYTPAIVAAAYKQDRSLSALIEAKADLGAKNNDGISALAFAINNRNVSTAKLLLNAGADANDCVFGTMSLLMLAVLHGNVELVQALLNKGAYVLHMHDGASVLDMAKAKGNANIIKIITDAMKKAK